MEEFDTKDVHSSPNLRETWAILGAGWEDTSGMDHIVLGEGFMFLD